MAATKKNMDEIVAKVYKLRQIMEKEYGSRAETTRLIEGIVSDIKILVVEYVKPQLRAMAFISKSKDFKKELESLLLDMK